MNYPSSIDETLQAYAKAHSSFGSPLLDELYRVGHVQLLQPRMMCGPTLASLLAMLIRLTGARRVLELGAYSGYSTIAMGMAVAEQGGEIHSIELEDEMIHFLTPFVIRSGYTDRIHLHHGDALTMMPELLRQYPFDFIYIDANKRQYPDYYHILMEYLESGALIVADNTLWDNKVLTPVPKGRDLQLEGIERFNEIVAKDGRVEQVLLPLRDGLTLIRVR